jgi:hypothetical protein
VTSSGNTAASGAEFGEPAGITHLGGGYGIAFDDFAPDPGMVLSGYGKKADPVVSKR